MPIPARDNLLVDKVKQMCESLEPDHGECVNFWTATVGVVVLESGRAEKSH